MNGYAFLADAIVTIHFVYIAFVILGQLAILIGWACGWGWIRNPWFRMIHLTMILIVVVESCVNYQCPLTTWEYDLRIAAGQVQPNFELKDVSFIGRNLNAIITFENTDGWLDWCYYAFGSVVLLTLLLVRPRFRRQPAEV